MELQEAIDTRRSVRKYDEYYVSDDELKKILDAARQAPSWSNTQVWEFIVVRDKELIEKVVSTYSEKNPAKRGSLSASALIVACARTDKSGCYNDKQMTKFSSWFMFDLGLAVQNLCLKAHEMNLGTVIVGLMDHDACKNVLSVPEGYEVVAVIPVGRPASAPKPGPGRKEFKDFVHLNTFGNPF